MNRYLCKKGMVLGIIFLFFGAIVIPVIMGDTSEISTVLDLDNGKNFDYCALEDIGDLETYIDNESDVFHYFWVPGVENPWYLSEGKKNIDIINISYFVSNDEITLILKLDEDELIDESKNVMYHVYYMSLDAVYLFFCNGEKRFGLERPTKWKGGATIQTVEQVTIENNSVSCTFDLIGEDTSNQKFYGFAYEWGEYNNTKKEYWVDCAVPNLNFPYDPYLPESVYVDNDSSGETPGWQIDHFETIEDGIEYVNTKGDVYVLNGTYYENVDVYRPINLLGQCWETTVIDGETNGDVLRLSATSGNILITGFKIRNSADEYSGVKLDSGGNHVYRNKIINNFFGIKDNHDNNRIGYNSILLTERNGVVIGAEVNNTIIENNIISNEDFSPSIGGQHNGITSSGHHTPIANIKINNNTIEHYREDGIEIDKRSSLDIYNNTIRYCKAAGVYLVNTKDVAFRNNTIYGNSVGLYAYGLSYKNNNIIENNTFKMNNFSLKFENTFILGERELHDNNFLDAIEYEVAIDSILHFSIVWGPSNYWGDDIPGPRENMKIDDIPKGLFNAKPWATEIYPIHNKFWED